MFADGQRPKREFRELHELLSATERRCLDQLLQGKNLSEAARSLGTHPSTMNHAWQRIRERLEIASFVELGAYAQRHNLPVGEAK
jgi:DNA-binding CsgD family transcriptional regulator